MEQLIKRLIEKEQGHYTGIQFQILLTELPSLNEEQVADKIHEIYSEALQSTWSMGVTHGRSQGLRGVTK